MVTRFFCAPLAFILSLFLVVGCEPVDPQKRIVTGFATPLELPPSEGQAAPQESTSLVDYIVVQKEDRVVTLWKKGRIVKTYPILAMGAVQTGTKTKEGDEKTPEGLYYIDDKHPSQNFQKFLKISYPNQSDIGRARQAGYPPGGNVGIHGDRGGFSGFMQRFKTDWTDGCIAMRNADIEDIYEMVDVGTPISIKP